MHTHVPGKVGVLVIDWFHWRTMGDWSFDRRYWPDPQAMVDEVRSYGIEIMASVWPYTCPGSSSFEMTNASGWISTNTHGEAEGAGGPGCHVIDPTNPFFRKYMWDRIEHGYHQYGIKTFWLDSSEPWTPPAQGAYLGRPRSRGACFFFSISREHADGERRGPVSI